MSLGLLGRFLAVGIMLLYIPFTQAAAPEWMTELRRMGFQGRAVVNQDPRWRVYGLSPLAFLVTKLPERVMASSMWPFINQGMIDEMRVIQVKRPVRIILANSLENGKRLRAAIAIEGHPFWQRLDWPGTHHPMNLILTQTAPPYAIPHESRHLDDYALHLDLHLTEYLDEMGWEFDESEQLRSFIMEVRAIISEVTHYQGNDEASRAETFDLNYLDPIKKLLRAGSYTQALRFATLVRAYTNDLPNNSVSQRIFASLEEEWPCSEILARSLR